VAVALLGNKTPLLISARDYGYFCANRTLLHQGRPCSGPALAKCLACAGDYYGRPKGWVATVGVFASAPLLRRKVTAAHSISRFVSAEMRRHFLKTASGRREVVIPSFRDESDRGSESANGALAQLPSKPFILYVGQFRRAKGLEVLFEAYEKLTAPPPLVLIGSQNWDGPEELPGYATVLRSLPHEAVMEAWDRAAFGVMPSLWPEPFGSVVHEAMSRGKAVVGTSHGGHPDMIRDGESGLLVPPGDSTALRAAMQRLLDEAELRDRLGAAARERARLFDAENVIPRFAELYESLAVREST
jgi:glycosyltransferase involved in cell wall biosynthesis